MDDFSKRNCTKCKWLASVFDLVSVLKAYHTKSFRWNRLAAVTIVDPLIYTRIRWWCPYERWNSINYKNLFLYAANEAPNNFTLLHKSKKKKNICAKVSMAKSWFLYSYQQGLFVCSEHGRDCVNSHSDIGNKRHIIHIFLRFCMAYALFASWNFCDVMKRDTPCKKPLLGNKMKKRKWMPLSIDILFA